MADKNMEIYEAVRSVPKEAKKPISGGRLKGMTDINPMWRIKTLTEQFGPCGFGWHADLVERWTEKVEGTTEIAAFVKIELFVKQGNEWSKGIVGIGGSMLSTNERNGLYVNDECFKMAYTDAISSACKQLGVGADVYWEKDTTKYNDVKRDNSNEERATKTQKYNDKVQSAVNYAEDAGAAEQIEKLSPNAGGARMSEEHQNVLQQLLAQNGMMAVQVFGKSLNQMYDADFERAVERIGKLVKKGNQ